MSNLFTKKKLTALSLILISGMSILPGCAMMFSSKKQKVTLQSATKDATIEYEKAGISKNSKKISVDKRKFYHVALVKKDGYKSTNYAFQPTKRSPTIAFAVLDLAIPLYGWFFIPTDFVSPKTKKYAKIQTIPALQPYEQRKQDEKYMLINNTAFDAKGADITWHEYLSINGFKNEDHHDSRYIRKSNKSKDREDIKVDNTIFTSALNRTMKDMNFIDTTETVFTNINNSLYLNATVKKITVHYVTSKAGRNPKFAAGYQMNSLMSIELQIDWEVLDYYKQSIYTTKSDKRSDLFIVPYGAVGFNDVLLEAIKDNMEYSVLDIRKQLSDKGTLNVSNAKIEAIPAITISKPAINPNSRMNDFIKSSVTIKVDDGHGSGVIVSEDGYIVTAYHVVAGSKKIEVIINDTTKVEAEVIRKNTEADLALIKIKKTGLSPLLLSQNPDPEIGVDVWAIGTPKSMDLGKSVSKGILSGLRKANNVSYLQTDVSLNGGNSGGPLISKDGTVLGIVTSKLIGVGTEGVGFAISTQEIFNKLKVVYKD